MSENASGHKSGGIGICTVLFVTFLVLKLCHVIDWSWWWVTSPLWIPAAILGVILLVVLALALGGYIQERRRT